MSKNHVKAAILAGLVLFVWGMFSWMMLPFHHSNIMKFTDESARSGA